MQASTLRNATDEFTQPNDVVATAAFAFDVTLYLAGVVAAVTGESPWLKIAGVVAAGTATSTLFILGHDAAHKSLFASRLANAIVARIAFLPCLHNYTLWVIQHNRMHHQATNVRGANSFWPLSLAEYRALPRWRRALERCYRNVAGFGVYYLVERWWKDKYFPRAATPDAKRAGAWRDFALLSSWLVALCAGLVALADATGQRVPAVAIVWGFVLPFLVWNALMGLTAYLQHTHPRLPWFRSQSEARAERGQGELATHVVYPAWYDLLSHNIMWHPAHHANPRVPWFRLQSAQRRLNQLLGERVIVERMTPAYVLRLTRACQLYDYDARLWLDFHGRPTTMPEERAPRSALAA
jgi:omega-6 fatty acid desaturase (delta-12 desaturase)